MVTTNSLNHPLATPAQQQRIRDELLPEESLVFMSPIGKNSGGVIATIAGGLFFLAICLFFLVTLIDTELRHGFTWMRLVLAMVLLLFFLITFYILSLPVLIPLICRKTVFALTDRRAIVSGSKRTSFLPLDEIARFSYIEHADQSGTLAFDTHRPLFRHVLRHVATTFPQYMSLRFPSIREVERMVRTRCLPLRQAGCLPEDFGPVELTINPEARKLIDKYCDPDEQVIWAEAASPATLYALTNKRALALEQWSRARMKITSYPIGRTFVDEQINRRNGRGDLIFYRQERKGADGDTAVLKEGFRKINHPDKVGTMLRMIRQSCREEQDSFDSGRTSHND